MNVTWHFSFDALSGWNPALIDFNFWRIWNIEICYFPVFESYVFLHSGLNFFGLKSARVARHLRGYPWIMGSVFWYFWPDPLLPFVDHFTELNLCCNMDIWPPSMPTWIMDDPLTTMQWGFLQLLHPGNSRNFLMGIGTSINYVYKILDHPPLFIDKFST